MPQSAARLLSVLVEIERHAEAMARFGGCVCSEQVADTDRNYPYCVFSSDTAKGRPFHDIPWEMKHENGCVMDGQRGVG